MTPEPADHGWFNFLMSTGLVDRAAGIRYNTIVVALEGRGEVTLELESHADRLVVRGVTLGAVVLLDGATLTLRAFPPPNL